MEAKQLIDFCTAINHDPLLLHYDVNTSWFFSVCISKLTIDPVHPFFFFGWVLSTRKEVYLGDENALTLTFNARNEGEGGAYEAELHVVLPPEADYSGIARNNEVRGGTEKLAMKTYNIQEIICWSVLLLSRVSLNWPAAMRRRTRPGTSAVIWEIQWKLALM